MNKQQRWINNCKNLRVVFLLFGRKSQSCRMQLGSTYNIDGCLKKHNRMLHSPNQEDELEQKQAQNSVVPPH